MKAWWTRLIIVPSDSFLLAANVMRRATRIEAIYEPLIL
jgi:hypothetical protein